MNLSGKLEKQQERILELMDKHLESGNLRDYNLCVDALRKTNDIIDSKKKGTANSLFDNPAKGRIKPYTITYAVDEQCGGGG